jgi:hypothetical protein
MILTPNFVSPVTERKKGMQAQSVWYRLVFFLPNHIEKIIWLVK